MVNVRTYPPDAHGECDHCHDDHVALWDDVTTEGAGDFQYCSVCWERRINRRADDFLFGRE